MTQHQTIREFLASQSTLVLSTVTREGSVRSAPLFYLLDGQTLTLYWLSSASSEHSVNAVEHSTCAVSVFRSTQKWEEIAGVQMTGLVGLVPGGERARIVKGYCERFGLGGQHSTLIAQSGLSSFRPGWVRFIDNSKGLGYKFELTLDGAAGSYIRVRNDQR